MLQTNHTTIQKNTLLKSLVFLFSIAALTVIFSGTANAASSGWYPQDPPPSPDSPTASTWQYVVNSRVGNGSQLQSPTTYLEARVSEDTTHIRFQTYNIGRQASALDGSSGPSSCQQGQVLIRVYGSNYDGTINRSNVRTYDPAQLVANGDGDACTGYAQFHFRLNGGTGGFGSPLNAPATLAGYKHVYFRVDLLPTVNGGSNKFKVEASGFRRSGNDNGFNVGSASSHLGFAASSIASSTSPLPFALVRGPLDPVPQDDYSVRWALPCDFAGSRLTVRWFDADNAAEGGNPPDTGISWYVRNDTTGARINMPNGYPLGGNNVPGEYVIRDDDFINPEHKYTFHWTGVQGNNGIQMVLPYAEASYDTTKCDWDYQPEIRRSTARPGNGISTPSAGATLTPGNQYQIEATVRNDGPGAGPRYNFRVDPINGGPFGLSTSSHVTLSAYSDSASGNTLNNSNRTLLYPGQAFLSPASEAEDRAQWGTCRSSSAVFGDSCSDNFGGDPTPGSPRGLSPGETAPLTRYYTFTVNSDAPAGTPLCFQSRVSSFDRGTPSMGQFRDTANNLCFTVGDGVSGGEYILENEAATFGKSVDPATGCELVQIGSIIKFESTIDNTGGGDARDRDGNVADARINDTELDSFRVGALINKDDISVPANSTALVEFNSYSIPANGVPGQIYNIEVYYLIFGTTPTLTEGDFRGITGQPRNASQSGPRVARACIILTDSAYLKVEGSGVYSGALWRTLEECIAGNFLTSVDANRDNIEDNFSRIQSNIATVGARTIGSSTEYGATSIFNPITGFASGIDDQSASIPANKNDQNKLSFANTGSEPGEFIGDDLTTISSNSIKCLPDLFGHLNDQEPVKFSLNDFGLTREEFLSEYGDVDSPLFYTDVNLPDRNGVLTNTTNGADDIPENPIVLIEATADNPAQFDHVLFAGDLKYTSNYGTFNGDLNIPGLVIIVKGDLRISGNVEQMDGLFIAIPSGVDSNGNTVGGNIYTCAEFETNNALCDRPLTINGALIANDVKFQRFSGGVAAAANSGGPQRQFASEIIRFSPELYISDPFAGVTSLLTNGGGFSDRYDYYKERPPIY
jgi:hypothetical protein